MKSKKIAQIPSKVLRLMVKLKLMKILVKQVNLKAIPITLPYLRAPRIGATTQANKLLRFCDVFLSG